MARAFDGTNDQYIANAIAVVNAAPFTVAGWFYSQSDSAADVIFGLGDDVNSRFEIFLRGDLGGDPIGYVVSDGVSLQVVTTTGYTINTWHQVCIIEAAVDDRSVLIDGGSKGTSSGTRTPTGVTATTLGASGRLTNEFTGYLAEWFVWNVALTDDEAYAHYKGGLVRPQSQVAYWRLLGNLSPEPDMLENKYDLTLYDNPTKADHPPVIYPVSPQTIYVPPIVPVVGPFPTFFRA